MLSRPVLLYDGECAFCRAWVRRLQQWDRRRVFAYVPFQERGGVGGLPPLDQDSLERAMHLVDTDGSVTSGARTLPVLGRHLPYGIIVRALYAIPGAGWVADRVYAWVARRRHRLGCGSASCRLG